MTLAFKDLWVLWFLLLPALATVLALWRGAGHLGRRRLICVVLPALAVAFWILAAASPLLLSAAPARQFIVTLDLSGSTIAAPWRKPQWVKRVVRKELPGRRDVVVVGFAGHAYEIFGNKNHRGTAASRWPRRWPRFTGRRTDLAGALAYRPRGFSTDAPRWIFTDGFLAWPRAPGFATALTIVPPARPDVGVTRFRTFPTHAAGERKLAVVATLHATGATHATVRLYRNKRLVARRAIRFSGPGWRTVRLLDAPPGNHARVYRVQVESGDPWPQDNVAKTFVPAPGVTHVLLVTASRAPFVANAAHILISRISPSRFPLALAGLTHEQIVVLWDVPRWRLSAAARTLLRRYVSATGGGLLFIGGRHAFGPGGYAVPGGDGLATLQALSPLSSLPPNPRLKQVIFLLDGSGSMGESAGNGESKFAVAAASARRAMGLLPPKQPCAILIFHNRTRILLRGAAGTVRRAIRDSAAHVVPTGATILNSALPALRRLLRPGSDVILLTDGQIPHIAAPRWAALLHGRHSQLDIVAPVRLHAVKPTALARLALATHAAVLATDNPRRWPALVTRALARRLAGRAHTRQITWRTWRGPQLAGATGRWIRTWKKRRSELWAASAMGNVPLAATWRVGLGHVGAVTFTENAANYARLLARIIAAVKALRADPRFVLSVRPDGRHCRITAQAVSGHSFLNNRALLVETGGNAAHQKVAFRQTGPGRYTAQVLRRRRPLVATVSEKAGGRWRLIGRINFPRLPGREWPATAPHRACPWPHVTLLPPTGPGDHRWRPVIARPPLPLRMPLLLLGAAMALVALVLRGQAAQRVLA